MTKQLILTFAVFCTLQARANVQPVQEDTVRHYSRYEATELLQFMQPAYLDGVVLPMSRTGNWFVSIAGGMTAFLGTPLGCEDLFGRVKPSYSFAVGKWFTPSVGTRINYSGLQFKDAELSSQDYHYIRADLLWNILGRGYTRQKQVRWGLAPFAGVGLLHNSTNGSNLFALSYGVQGQYRISRRVSATLELSNTITFQDFDGYGRPNRLGDHLFSLTAGFTFHLGKVGWKRAVDATPYIRRNEQLVDYANCLTEENRRYAGQHDRDRRTLAELKKILEIEGLLGTYSYMFGKESGDGRKTYPVNNYSGLNSLRARLKYRHWDGTSPLDTTALQSRNGNLIYSYPSSRGALSEHDNPLATDSTTFMYVGGECVGAPVYFFFSLNTARLTDASQMLNLDGLARVAKKYNLSVKITGAADSSTGTPAINDSLSTARAEFVAVELERRGVSTGMVIKVGIGGIANHIPTEANRHTRVELFFPNPERTSE
ncbi:OmpA family protein [Bacteroides thetaiotaomicron]|uniref:OmpA family protein n=1 Tax=Bacteroides thetaiotaomicron TaxID=818 RepID=UPI001F1DF6A5|nr:OmpA family protein [Bacteroides thetaiotaomicron]MCE8780462.1 OmpA family protein [Bacteroides thetaiotaomicron]